MIPPNYKIEGAELKDLSQAQLYQGIRESHEEDLDICRGALVGLDMIRWATIRWATKERWGIFPTDHAIWQSIRQLVIDRKIRAFLYRVIHDTNKIGQYWERIPNYEHRSRCQKCDGTTESLEHIMTECEASGQKQVWKLATESLASRNIDTSTLSIGDIMGCAMPQFKKTDGKPDTALN